MIEEDTLQHFLVEEIHEEDNDQGWCDGSPAPPFWRPK